MEISAQHVLGLTEEHIFFATDERIKRPIHVDIVEPFLRLQADAKDAGFDLQLVSGFRDFDRQLRIWSAKAAGERALLDDHGVALDFAMLKPEQLLEAILRWSALPGGSRHHWGTDVDVFDAAAVDVDYDVQLTREEVEGDGPFTALHDWLDSRIETSQAHGFFRPYDKDRGGVAPERWHLSYAPLAYQFQQVLTQPMLVDLWRETQLPLLAEVEKNWDAIWQRFIWLDDARYPQNLKR